MTYISDFMASIDAEKKRKERKKMIKKIKKLAKSCKVVVKIYVDCEECNTDTP